MNLPKILSAACGHLREAQLSQAVKDKRICEYVGLDQDEASLEVVHAEQQAHSVSGQRFGQIVVDRKA